MTDRTELAAEIRRRLDARGAGKTICPSEVARACCDDWRALMPQVREVAQELADTGELRITAKGVEVRADAARGPIRLGRA